MEEERGGLRATQHPLRRRSFEKKEEARSIINRFYPKGRKGVASRGKGGRESDGKEEQAVLSVIEIGRRRKRGANPPFDHPHVVRRKKTRSSALCPLGGEKGGSPHPTKKR